MVWMIFLCALFGYLLGTINPAYIMGRMRGIDIRKSGSKNAGASNALLLIGKSAAIYSAIFDMMKAAVAVWLAPFIFKKLVLAAEIAGAAAIIGHIFPFYMKFRGGKGTACLGGVVLAIDWRLLLILLAAELFLAVLTDYLCTVPITAAFLFPVLYGTFGADGLDWLISAKGGWRGAAVLAVAMVVILLMNVKNINRILHGTEMHFSYVWSKNKDAEIARICANEERWQEKINAKRGKN